MINNGKVFVVGSDVTPDTKNIIIEVNGNLDKLQVDFCSKITVKGSVGDIKTQSGNVDVDCNQIHGNVSTMSSNIRNRK